MHAVSLHLQPLMIPSLLQDKTILSCVSKSARSKTQSSWQALEPPCVGFPLAPLFVVLLPPWGKKNRRYHPFQVENFNSLF